MLTRRSLLLGSAPLALAGCAGNITINGLYTSVHKAAAVLEQALVTAKTNIQKAAQDIQPYLQPIAQILVMLNDIGLQLVKQGVLKADNADVIKALNITGGFAADPIIKNLADFGTLPTNPTEWAVAIIPLVIEVVKLTSGAIRPATAVASK